MIVLLAAALVGGLVSFAVLWPYGILTALVGAQLGATFLAFLVCPVLASRGSKAERKQSAALKLVLRAGPRENGS